jgi:hypothetical protein
VAPKASRDPSSLEDFFDFFKKEPSKWMHSRAHYLERGQVWLGERGSDPISTARGWEPVLRTLDLRAGPARKDAFAPNANVTGVYSPQQKTLFSGKTPKFRMVIDGEEKPAKVKYGENNDEVMSETVTSRLFWALGFGADASYVVSVDCRDCPLDPWAEGTPRPNEVARFPFASIERSFPGSKIEDQEDQGWSFDELERVRRKGLGAPAYQIDALKLLAAFVQHPDSRPAQQRLVCRKGESVEQPDGRQDCRAPFLLIHDLGATFGRMVGVTQQVYIAKMDLDAWESVPVWKSEAKCIASQHRPLYSPGGLKDPRISEDGRAFLAELLGQLTDADLAAIFDSGHAERKQPIARWVAAFKNKREQILAARCPR